MKFIERLGYGNQAYLVVASDVPSVRSFELMLRRQRDTKPWAVRTRGDETPWVWLSRDDLLATLVHCGADLHDLEARLKALALEQVMYADLVRDAAAELLGVETLDAARLAHQQFVETLKDAVSKLVTRHKVIEGDGNTTPRREGHLHVVGGPQPPVV